MRASKPAPAAEPEPPAFHSPWLIGQAPAERMLARAAERGSVAGAYLFLGPRSCGKATAARLFAQVLNCEQPAAEPDRLRPCLTCLNCRRIGSEKHPEVMFIHPGSKSGQFISVEQAREVRKDAVLRPKLGRRRMYLLPQAEALNEESGNALLKTLEEPQECVTLVLCAPNPSQVLPTIRSRCQLVRFALAATGDIEAALRGTGVEPGAADLLARSCGGRPGLALAWSRSPELWERRKQVRGLFLQALRLRESAAATPALAARSLRMAETLRALAAQEGGSRGARLQTAEALDSGLALLRDAMLLAHGSDASTVTNQDCLPDLQSAAASLPAPALMHAITHVREAQQLLHRNVTEARVLERMFWKLIAA